MSSEAPQPESAQDIEVRLKPVFGVDPKYYLAALYTVLILSVLFALLVWPGLSRPGTKVTVTSTPPGAAVFYAGKHYGTTPFEAFFPEGTAALTVEKPGFSADSRDYRSGNSLFFSLFLPKTDRVEVSLKPESDTSVADRARSEAGRWALAVPFGASYRFPLVYTRFAADAKAAGWDLEKIRAFLLSLRSSVADPQMYQDYGRALGLWGADAGPPEGLETQYQLWAPVVGGESDRLALWLLANQTKPLRDREATASEMSDWLKARLAGLKSGFQASVTPSFTATPGALRAAGQNFRGVGQAAFLWGSSGTTFNLPTEPPFQVPVAVKTEAFWIADTEVTQAQWAAFVAASPKWAPAGRDALIAEGLADADYLAGWTSAQAPSPAEPVSSVSWYAARAYCAWLNASQAPAGKKAVLPDDFQWEAAARAPGGASMLNQGVWEWTASAWYPADALVLDSAAEADKSSYARSLKGGIALAKSSITAADRAGWPAAGSTPSLGFRVALVNTP